MLIKFSNPEIQSFDSGNRTFINAGEVIEVPDEIGEALLLETARLYQGTEKGKPVFDSVQIFERVERTPKHSLLPEDFPHREDLEKNNIKTFADLFTLTAESEPALKNIGEKRLADILAAREGFNEDGTAKETENAGEEN